MTYSDRAIVARAEGQPHCAVNSRFSKHEAMGAIGKHAHCILRMRDLEWAGLIVRSDWSAACA
jgi:hypothetical protein